MGLVSVRLEDGDESFLRKRKANISEVIRRAVHYEVKRLQVEDAVHSLARMSWKPTMPAEEEVRRHRDARRIRP